MGGYLHTNRLGLFGKGLIAPENCSACQSRDWLPYAAMLRTHELTRGAEDAWRTLQKRARQGRAPTREQLIRFCLHAGASPEETQRLLRVARRQELYPRVRRDAVILFCLRERCDPSRCHALLLSQGQCGLYP